MVIAGPLVIVPTSNLANVALRDANPDDVYIELRTLDSSFYYLSYPDPSRVTDPAFKPEAKLDMMDTWLSVLHKAVKRIETVREYDQVYT